MSLFITSLNSGSNGNCYYIGNDREAILVDAGISCRETVKRMQQLGLAIDRVKAILVSHEHSDHITGIPGLSKKYQLPVYITSGTHAQASIPVEQHLVRPFRAYEPIQIGDLTITAFPKFHDAGDPHSFIVTCSGVTVGIFTDIGNVCQHLVRHFSQCHAAFLEANYDEEMLEKGNYPYYLKQRIRGGKGHLSNTQALKLVLEHKSAFMSHLILSHLSKNNNSPELVERLFRERAGQTEIMVASRYAASPLYHITAGQSKQITTLIRRKKNKPVIKLQLELF